MRTVILCHQGYPELPEVYRLPRRDSPYTQKFVICGGDLVIGNIDRHALLVALYRGVSLCGANITRSIKEVEKSRKQQVLGAGNVFADGTLHWGSLGFRINGPPQSTELTIYAELAVRLALRLHHELSGEAA